jgi:cytochrome P450
MLPPGPRAPRLVQTLEWGLRPVEFLERARARHGDAFTLRLAHEGTWVVLSDPEAIRDVLTADPAIARAGEANAFLGPLLGPQSVMLLDAPAHLERRRLLLPPLHGERLRGHETVMRDAVAREVATWRDGRRLRVLDAMRRVTLDVIVRAVFGVEEAARVREAHEAIAALTRFSTRRSTMLGVLALGYRNAARHPWLHAARRPVERVIDAAGAQPGSVLAELREAGLEGDALRAELLTLLIAGHETTASALAWAIEALLHHPRARERLGEEGYADAVVKESLRLRPVVPVVSRRLAAPLVAGGRELPAGVAAVPCSLLVHRDPRIYPEPLAFRPERFLDRAPGTYTWLPFGGGPRRCLGAAFAQFEMRVVLDELGRRAALEPFDATRETVVRRATTLVPRYGVEVRPRIVGPTTTTSGTGASPGSKRRSKPAGVHTSR